MCGRYFFDLNQSIFTTNIKQKIAQLSIAFAQNEIYPSQHVLVLVEQDREITVDVMKWGLTSYKGSLLINARSVGIEEKKTFRPMLEHRCLIPCNGFYEWKNKKKIYITKKNEEMFYLAGIYNEQKEFVIVTGESQKQMKQIHHRTPIILHEADKERYIRHDCEFAVDNEDLEFELEG